MTEKPTAPKLTVPYDPRDRHVHIEWNPAKPADCTHPRIASGTRFIVTEVTGMPDQRAEAPALRCRTCGAMFGPELPTEFQLPPGRPVEIQARAGWTPDPPKPLPWWWKVLARIGGRR